MGDMANIVDTLTRKRGNRPGDIFVIDKPPEQLEKYDGKIIDVVTPENETFVELRVTDAEAVGPNTGLRINNWYKDKNYPPGSKVDLNPDGKRPHVAG